MASHRLRTLLAMLGIVIGITSVVSVVALGQGAQQKVVKDIGSMGTNVIEVNPGKDWGDEDAATIHSPSCRQTWRQCNRKCTLTRSEARNALSILFDQAPENTVPERQRLAEDALPRVEAGIPASLLAQLRDPAQADHQIRRKVITDSDFKPIIFSV